MNKNKQFKLGLLLLLGVFVTSCQNENEVITEKSSVDSNEITETTAVEIANNLIISGVNTGQFSKNGNQKKLSTLETVVTKNNETAFYIANYQNGGFAIIAADNRNTPILAFSETNSFKNDTLNFPEAMKNWFNFQKEVHSKIRKENKKQTLLSKHQWDFANNKVSDNTKLSTKKQTLTAIDYPPEYYANQCFSSPSQQLKPLLTTKWGQDYGYNSLVPLNCPSHFTGKAYTGCVATAMAQIMKYYKMPSSYNWNNMPDNGGTTDVAILMRDIGKAVNMDYGCEGSGADSEKEIASSLINDFKYKNASVSDYNWRVVYNN